MYPWEGMAGQALGMGMAQAQRAYPYPGGNYLIANPATTHNNCYIGNNTAVGYEAGMIVEAKPPELPDEFTQLSNHKFHELLDKFSETI